MNKIKKQNNKGFVLLWTLLISVVLTGVIISVSYTSLTQHNLSVTLRESQQAYYVAKMGHDCAVFWQLKEEVFTSTPSADITCAGNTVTVGGGILDFSLDYKDYTAEVSLTKTATSLIIDSKGFSRNVQRNFSGEISIKGLVAYWKFDDEEGVIAIDSSGNGNHGALTNGPVWTTGRVNGGLRLDGIDDYVSASLSGLDIVGNQITLSGWARVPPEGIYEDQAIINKITTDVKDWSDYPYMIGVQSSADPNLDETNCRISTSFGDARINIATVPREVWVHLACSYDGSNVKTYVNGSLIDTTPLTGTINPGSDIRLGARRDDRRYEGDMDELRIYDRALSEDEISDLYWGS